MTSKKNFSATLLAFVLTLSIFTFSMTAYAAQDKAPQTDEEWDAILDGDEDVADDIIPCGVALYSTVIMSNDTTDVQPIIFMERY